MTADEILALARKCGFYAATDNFCGCSSEALQSFAAAIAEECARLARNGIWAEHDVDTVIAAIRAAFPAPETKP